MLVYHGGTPTWRLNTGLCKLGAKYFKEYLKLGKHTDLKIREVSSLLIPYGGSGLPPTS